MDAPVLYALWSYSMEENGAAEEIKNADIIINVVDALTLENSLNLTRSLIGTGKPLIIYVTKLNALKKRGGRLDTDKLSASLGIRVYACTPRQLKTLQKRRYPFLRRIRAGAKDSAVRTDCFTTVGLRLRFLLPPCRQCFSLLFIPLWLARS